MMTSVRALTLILLLIFLTFSQALANENICPPLSKVEGYDDLRMQEKEFTFKYAENSLDYLKDFYPKKVASVKTTQELLNWSGNFISYANSLRFIEGTLLKQEALLKLAQYNALLKNKSQDNKTIKNAEINYEQARKNFCNFLDTAEYVD